MGVKASAEKNPLNSRKLFTGHSENFCGNGDRWENAALVESEEGAIPYGVGSRISGT
jgi:hypothetical protein